MKNLRSEEEIVSNWKRDVNKPVVSIICQTYNHEPYVEEALEGFLIQETDFPFEIIIHDDASPDRTADIIREYEVKYPKLIKSIYQTKNRFSQGLRNGEVIYPRTKGKYIALCEGDDYWTDPLKLQKQVDFLENNFHYGGCFHDCLVINEKQDGNDEQYFRIGNRTIEEEVDLASIIDENNIATASILFKKFTKNTWEFTQKTSKGDYALMVLIAEQGKIKYLPEVMSAYRIHDGGIWSSRGEIYKEEEAIKFYNLLQEYFADNKDILKALSRKKKYSYYLLSRKFVYAKQRLKSLHYLVLSLDFLHRKHPNIKYYNYFKELLKSVIK